VQSAVRGYDAKYEDRVKAQNLDATTPQNAEICKRLGFANHGLVIRSMDGEDLWSQPDHEVKLPEVAAKIEELLGS
jgi:hypothetical protein